MHCSWHEDWQSLFIFKDSCKIGAVQAERSVTHFANQKDKSDNGNVATGNLC